MYCGDVASNCTEAQEALPFEFPQFAAVKSNNNNHSMQYYDLDNDPETWCSSSDILPCSVFVA